MRFFFLTFIYFWETDRDRARAGEGQTKGYRIWSRLQDLSCLLAQSQTWGSNSWTARPWPELKSDAQPTEPLMCPLPSPWDCCGAERDLFPLLQRHVVRPKLTPPVSLLQKLKPRTHREETDMEPRHLFRNTQLCFKVMLFPTTLNCSVLPVIWGLYTQVIFIVSFQWSDLTNTKWVTLTPVSCIHIQITTSFTNEATEIQL